jgi:hypothetical protein
MNIFDENEVSIAGNITFTDVKQAHMVTTEQLEWPYTLEKHNINQIKLIL